MKLRFAVLFSFWMFWAASLHGQANPPLKFLQNIDMPNVEGYFDHPAIDGFRSLGLPFVVDGQRPPLRRVPPALGEHQAEVLDELGLTARQEA